MFKLPDKITEDFKKYKYSLEDMEAGKVSPSRFKGIRVPWGIYSHRGGKVYMTRIRVPAGLITAAQLKALAIASKEYGDGVLHITTRQDIQIHNVKIEDTVRAMEYLRQFGLSPRGGGGNTVRNVIGCSLAGVCKEEVFDIRRYAVSLTEHLLSQDNSFNLPRKFKVSFSGCKKDCAGCLINDVGFVAERRNGTKGFKVFVGGGLGANSIIGKLLEDFISEDEVGYCTEGIKNIFYKKGDRRNKHRNRLRFLVEDIGLEEFKRIYKEEVADLKNKEHIALRKIDFSAIEEDGSEIADAEDKEYKEFLKYNIQPQKQRGFSSVELRIPRGDISSKKLLALSGLEKHFSGIEFRTSQHQNLIILWVKNRDLCNLFLKIKGILNDFLYPQTLLDVVVCKGALTCNLGLCNSSALAKEMEGIIEKGFVGKKVFRKLEIKLNGCPNACGQHPVGKLAFHGIVKRVDNRPVPFYKFLLGGRKEGKDTRLAIEVGIVPAKNILGFLREFLNRLEENIDERKDIYELLWNDAEGIANEVIKDYQYVPPYSEDRDFYVDWGRVEEFSLAGLGPGECGAGVLDMIDSDITDAGLALQEARNRDYEFALVKKAIFYTARALLVVKGLDPKGENEALKEFKERFVNEGIASDRYSDIENIFGAITPKLSLDERKAKFKYAEEFLAHVNEVYKSMDSSFNFPKIGPIQTEGPEAGASVLDLKGTPCPINYVKAKLFLEGLDTGSVIEIFLDEGEPMDNVPKSLENDGHKILKIEKQNGFYKVVVQKQ